MAIPNRANRATGKERLAADNQEVVSAGKTIHPERSGRRAMAALVIRKVEGDFENVLVREETTQVAAHVQIPVNGNSRRVVVALPAGKSALVFETAMPAGWTLDGDLVPFAAADGQRGVAFTLATMREEISVPMSSILMNHTLMARFGDDPDRKNENRLKDLIQSGGIREIESKLGMSLEDLFDRGKIMGPGLDSATGQIAFTRRALDGKHRYRLVFAGDGAGEVRADGGGIRLSRKNQAVAGPLRLTVRASVDFEPLTPLPFAELVNEKGRELSEKDWHFAQATRNFEFLSFREKFLAGSWNFLSYFGRDTLISLRIMWPVLSPRAKQTGIQSVANEIAEEGIVNVTDEWTDDRTGADALESFFYEYGRGDLDRAKRLLQTIVDGTVPEHPFLDVLDQTYMAPSAAAHWFRELDDGELGRWLRADHPVLGRTESNLATLLRNWNYVLKSAAPYVAAWRHLRAAHPELESRQIIAKHPEEFRATCGALVHSVAGAANWRDTYTLPWYFRSEDINVDLLPMAIAAIEEMAARIRALGGGPDLEDQAQQHALVVVREYLADPGRFAAAREAWNWDLVREHFLVRRTADEMRRDLERYLAGLANGDVTGGDRDRGVRERDATLRCREGGVSAAEFLRGDRVPASVKNGIEFTALLLDPEGHRLPVMQSDDVFLLLFGHPTLEQYRKIVRPLVLSYPFGLGFWDDDVGFAVSNGVYAPKEIPALKDDWKNAWVKFGPDEYHGRAAWPWVLFALVAGTHGQVLKGIDPKGVPGPGVGTKDVAQFRTILEKSQAALAKLGPLATSEVYKFAPEQAGTGNWRAEPMGISTPIQLWSAAPIRLLVDEALERIGLAGRCGYEADGDGEGQDMGFPV